LFINFLKLCYVISELALSLAFGLEFIANVFDLLARNLKAADCGVAASVKRPAGQL